MNSECALLFESFYVKIIITLQHMWYFSNSVGFGPTSGADRIVPKDQPYFWHPLQVQGGVPEPPLVLIVCRDSQNSLIAVLLALTVIVHDTERVQFKISQEKKYVEGTWCTQEKYWAQPCVTTAWTIANQGSTLEPSVSKVSFCRGWGWS